MSSVVPALSFSEVKEHFTQWRSTRPYVRSAIPEQLWQEALSLCPRYSRHEICKGLGLNAASFAKRQKPPPQPGASESPFIEIPLPPNASSFQRVA